MGKMGEQALRQKARILERKLKQAELRIDSLEGDKRRLRAAVVELNDRLVREAQRRELEKAQDLREAVRGAIGDVAQDFLAAISRDRDDDGD